jgi:hypothetical protein
MVLSRPSRSLLLVCWLPSVLPLACSEHGCLSEYVCIRTETLCAAPCVLFQLFLTTFKDLQPDNYHSVFCYILFVVYVFLFQPIPSLRLIYRSFLRTVMTVNLTMKMVWNHIPHQEMTKYTKYEASTQVGRV